MVTGGHKEGKNEGKPETVRMPMVMMMMMILVQVDIKAIVHDAGIPEGIGAVSVLNHYYGRDDILLGAYKGEYGKDGNGNWVRGHYVDHLVNNWDTPIRDSSQV